MRDRARCYVAMSARFGATLDEGRIEDIVEQAFVTGLAEFDSARSDANFSGFLFRIAYHLCLRECEHLRRMVDEDAAEPMHDPAPSPERTAAARRDLLSALDVLHQMKGRAAECLRLAVFEDLDVQQIADRLGLTTGTVQNKLTQARASLRSALPQLSARRSRRGRPRKSPGSQAEETR